jgi:quercetin dioxygenase-like cupin family protein
MKRIIGSVLFVLLACPAWQTVALAQTSAAPVAQSGAAPTIAFDITKAEIDNVLKNAPPNPPDRQLRVVDMGKYNLGVGIVHRGPTNDKPGDPIPVIYHDFTPETYIIVSGSGVLTTGGVIENKRASTGVPNVMNGPSGGGTAGAGAYSRRVQEGDIIIIPNVVAHGWSQITDHVTYLSVRPDPDRVLPAGYVYPLLLKNLPAVVPTPAPARRPQH